MMKQNKEQNRTHIGKVLDAHGIRGDIYCLVFSGDTSWLEKIKTLMLGTQIFEIKKIKPFKKGFIAALMGVQDRNQAEELKGREVWVDSSLFVSKDGEALYLSELLDFNIEDESLGKIGRISSFSTNGLQDLLVISNNNKTFEIPFVEEFVIDIDHKNKIIKMSLPEGLLDINEPDNDKN